ncbi:MAG: HAMP domain-containing histidine kinase, partial [Bacteroidetes bacterium]|nr:HAMP domain-containing histidine kinase [Bacteroidota bacterium]
FEERSKIMLSVTVDMFLFGVESSMFLGRHDQIQAIIDTLIGNKNIHHVRLFCEKGKILHSNNPGEIGKNIYEISKGHVPAGFIKQRMRRIDLREDIHSFTAFQPILNRPECQQCHEDGEVIAYLDIDTYLTKAERNFYTGSAHFVFLGIAVIILLSFGLYQIFNKLINKPLSLIINGLEKVESGDLTAQLPDARSEEFHTVNAHFNRMVEELKTNNEKIEEMHFMQLRHLDKLATVGELAAQLAHEINNYNAVMLSRADYLQLEFNNNSALKEYLEDLNVIQSQIEKISKMTGNVLRHSKKYSPEFMHMDLFGVVNLSLQILAPILKKKKIIIENAASENAIIIGDHGQIEQLIVNLLNNSIDAVSEDGIISIGAYTFKESVILEISDNGCGIKEDDLQNIFSPFFSTKQEGKGTGLGLYIVSNICKNHNAKITCESKLHNGTKFKIVFKRGDS